MFDIIVITAANAAQASPYRARLEYRLERGLLPCREAVAIPDSGNSRVGSLRATAAALADIAGDSDRAAFFRSARVLVVHCGGESRRTPAYAALGKAFIPVDGCFFDGTCKTMFDRIVETADRWNVPAGRTVVVSGDVVAGFDASKACFSASGITGVAGYAPAAVAARHGVYVPADGDSRLRAVRGFMQKPSRDAMKAAGVLRGGSAPVDSGIFVFDAPSAAALANWSQSAGGILPAMDIYEDLPAALLGRPIGPHGAKLAAALAGMPFSVNLVDRLDFFHVGSTRELVERVPGVRNVYFPGGRLPKIPAGSLVDACRFGPGVKLKLAGENVVTGVPPDFRGTINLARGECVAFFPVGAKGWRRFDYRIDDNFKDDGKWESSGLGEIAGAADPVRAAAEIAAIYEARRRFGTVRVSAPARIDFAGGWSDTPPICNAAPGCVVNAALTIDSVRPISATVRHRADSEVHVRSVDLRKRAVLRSRADLASCSDPGDWCALVKSALKVAGYRFRPGAGLDIAINARLPKGSGMGTSSILGASLLVALAAAEGRPYGRERAIADTLELERTMQTGGGWQDQLGAIVGGVKLCVSEAGSVQRPRAMRLRVGPRISAVINGLGLLYFTGQKRLARGILRDVVDFHRRDPHGIASIILASIRANALRCRDAIEKDDPRAFADSIASTWEDKKLLDPASTTKRVEDVFGRVSRWTRAVTLAGAGGGGFAFMLASSPSARAKIVEALAGAEGSFHEFAIDEEGMKTELGIG